MSTHNEKIKSVYGNFGFWSWLRYWYIDSANLVNMILMDKGFYDYDYEKTAPQAKDWVDTIKSQEEVKSMLAGFGFGQFAKKEETAEELQSLIIKEESHGS